MPPVNKRVLFPLGLVGCLISLFLVWPHGGHVRAQDSDLQAFRKLHSELLERMDADLQDAIAFLESKIAENPDSEDHNVLRHTLATRLVEEGDDRQAMSQFRKLLDYYLAHPGQRRNLFGAWMTIQSMQELATHSRHKTTLRVAVEDTLRAFDSPTERQAPERLLPVAKLTILKAQLLVGEEKTEAAKALIAKQLNQLGEINASDDGNEDSMTAIVSVLSELTDETRANDPWRADAIEKLDEAVTAAIEKYPDSIALQNAFAETQLQMISQWKQDDPEATKARIETVTPKLTRFSFENRSVQATLRRIEMYRERLESAKPVASLVGKPAPDWDIDAWVNVIELDPETLKGKVVLLDFWAMWCGPCIATFPHLREWRKEFAEQGFEIIGVTQYYNFQWDEANKRASHASEKVPPEEERRTLARFLDHHDLAHPVLVTPEGSTMPSDFGVRGIPHVVLIDRKGVVQLVKTGAGQETAQQIHEKIRELLKEQDSSQ